jgi:hypothetical protein
MEDVFDILKVVFISLAPPIISLWGAIAGKFIHTAGALGWLVAVVSAFQTAVVVYTAWAEVDSKQAKRLAPWLIGIGFIASWISIIPYGSVLSLLSNKWHVQLAALALLVSIFMTCAVAGARILDLRYSRCDDYYDRD